MAKTKKDSAPEIIKREIPPFLYHYTSLDSFLGIIKNKEMWASHILFMNDRTEFNLAFEKAKKIVGKLRQAQKLKEYIYIDVWRNLFRYFCENGEEQEDAYIISFSEKNDNFNMFKNYTDSSPGLCLEFDTAQLRTLQSEHSPAVIRMDYARYDNADQRQLLEPIITSRANDPNQPISPLLEAAPFIKHESFNDEAEWRVVIRVPQKKPHFRVRGSVILPYYKYGIGDKAITGITFGSHGDDEYIKKSLEMVCSQCYSNIKREKIQKSALPYRY